MTRKEHLEWAKQRALEYVDRGDLNGAYASMVSDLGKHPEFRSNGIALACAMGLMEIPRGSGAMRRWIDGFQ